MVTDDPRNRVGELKVAHRARPGVFAAIEDAVEAIQAGRMIIVVDDENRGTGFSRRHGRGKAPRAGPDHCNIDAANP